MRTLTGPESLEEAPLGKALDFMKLLWRLDHALQKTSRRMSASLGVTGPQRLALRVVGLFPGITPGETAAVLRLHPSTVTVIARGLERASLVERTEDPGDRRRTRLRLTAAGRSIAAAASGTVEEGIRRTLSRFPSPDLETASRVLSALAAGLETAGSRRGRGARDGRRPSPTSAEASSGRSSGRR